MPQGVVSIEAVEDAERARGIATSALTSVDIYERLRMRTNPTARGWLQLTLAEQRFFAQGLETLFNALHVPLRRHPAGLYVHQALLPVAQQEMK